MPRVGLREWRPSSDLVAEIQIRSILQHAWASISHGLDYKTGLDVPLQARRRLFRVAALLETGDELFDSFRDEVERIRAGYRQVLASDDWEVVPLDLDSLLEAWPRLPWADLHDAAVNAGWVEFQEGTELRSGETADWSRSKLVEAAHAAGIDTLGQLSLALTDIARDHRMLVEIRNAVSAADPDQRLLADAVDVAVMYWMSRLGSERIWGKGGSPLPYMPSIESATASLADKTSNQAPE